HLICEVWTVGTVRLFAKEAAISVGNILAEAREAQRHEGDVHAAHRRGVAHGLRREEGIRAAGGSGSRRRGQPRTAASHRRPDTGGLAMAASHWRPHDGRTRYISSGVAGTWSLAPHVPSRVASAFRSAHCTSPTLTSRSPSTTTKPTRHAPRNSVPSSAQKSAV